MNIFKFIKIKSIFLNIFNYIKHNSLYKGLFVLGSGTAVAHLIGITAMPIITRFYTPYDFGILAVYSSLLTIIGIGATLRYEFAYSLANDEKDATNLFCLSLLLFPITTVIFIVTISYGINILADNYDNFHVIKPYIFYLYIGFIAMGLYTILNYWAIRYRDYKIISYSIINQNFWGSSMKIVLGILSLGPIGLIFGNIISQLAGIVILSRVLWINERKNLKAISLNRMKEVALLYRDFPIYNFPASVLDMLAHYMPYLMLTEIYGAQIVGLYALANTVVLLPGSIISSSMGHVYFGEVAKMVREKSKEINLLYSRTLKHLFIIAIPLIGIPSLCAPFMFGLIFGEAWAEAGWYCCALIPMVIANFIVSSTSNLSTYGYNQLQFLWEIIRTIFIIGSFIIISYDDLSPILAIFIYGLIMTIMYLFLYRLNIIAINNININLENE